MEPMPYGVPKHHVPLVNLGSLQVVPIGPYRQFLETAEIQCLVAFDLWVRPTVAKQFTLQDQRPLPGVHAAGAPRITKIIVPSS